MSLMEMLITNGTEQDGAKDSYGTTSTALVAALPPDLLLHEIDL
jgi:hypothetical protein